MKGGDIYSCKKEITQHMKDLDDKDGSLTCFMSTLDAYNKIQTAMLDSVPREDIHLLTIDTVDCLPSRKMC